ncbi:hypothetical protein WM16_18555 [Burkholderia ubonensis]|uniref:Uncharacterized protein n=1 Tax=Burkholderia ubonensis TaxID=101571 RepID=A0A108CCK0_9BURK|nr:hypothetical protein WM16_18555 [Burkholderia ubonensis]
MQHLRQQLRHGFIIMRARSPRACFVMQTGEPCATNRFFQCVIAGEVTSHCTAISRFVRPSAAIRTILARRTSE